MLNYIKHKIGAIELESYINSSNLSKMTFNLASRRSLMIFVNLTNRSILKKKKKKNQYSTLIMQQMKQFIKLSTKNFHFQRS